jgi:glucose/arabinose dehydrogenase
MPNTDGGTIVTRPMLAQAGRGEPMRRTVRTVLATALALAMAAPALPVAAQPPPVQPRAIGVVTVKGGLDQPTAFTFAPDGRIWYVEKNTGRIFILNPKTKGQRLFTDISNVSGLGERGGLGIALHPQWPERPFVYVYVTRTDGGKLVNEVLRFRNDHGNPAGSRALFRWRVGAATNHNGGHILFGPDGNLWIVTGENANPAFSQRRRDLRGKILRIAPDGSIPNTNPFGTRVYATGIRNSFGMAFDPVTGRLWETENGPGCNDEINLIRRGGNYAWGPHQSCGSLPTPRDTNRDGANRIMPEEWFVNTIAITGAAFCWHCGLGGGRHGDLFYGDVNTARLWVSELNAARTTIVGSPDQLLPLGTVVYSMEVGPRNRIYFSGPNGIYRLTTG